MSMFVLKIVAAVALAHGYLAWRCVYAAGWSPAVRRTLASLLTAGFVLFLAGFFGIRLVLYDDLRILENAAVIWMGIIFFLFVLRLGWDAAQFAAWALAVVKRSMTPSAATPDHDAANEPADPWRGPANGAPAPAVTITRRALLARGATITAGVGAGALSFAGVRSAFHDITTPEVVVRLPRLPRALDGFRIAVLTDLHVGPFLRRSFVQRATEIANRLRPDAVVICGDLVDIAPASVASDLEPLASLRSRCGTYFVTGNHEYYWDAAACVDVVRRLGICVLDNERVSLGDASGGASFDLAGIHDPTGTRWNHALAPDIRPIAAYRDGQRELVLLAHQPLQLPAAVALEAGLQISGHTHGGQLWPFGAWVQRSQPYISGLHQHTPKTQIYVSRGTGFWGPPMRLLAPAEVTNLVLSSA